MRHFIYKTTCLVTKRYYVGMHSTLDLNDGYLGSGRVLRYSLKKYGRNEHRREILAECLDRDSLRDQERLIVNEDMINDPLCMNLRAGGDGLFNPVVSVRKKMSESAKRAWMIRKANGFIMPDETRKKLAEALRGKRRSETTKMKIREKLLGKPVSDKTKEKISRAQKGHSKTDSHRAKISEGRKAFFKRLKELE